MPNIFKRTNHTWENDSRDTLTFTLKIKTIMYFYIFHIYTQYICAYTGVLLIYVFRAHK